jgi:hypothetical protein
MFAIFLIFDARIVFRGNYFGRSVNISAGLHWPDVGFIYLRNWLKLCWAVDEMDEHDLMFQIYNEETLQYVTLFLSLIFCLWLFIFVVFHFSLLSSNISSLNYFSLYCIILVAPSLFFDADLQLVSWLLSAFWICSFTVTNSSPSLFFDMDVNSASWLLSFFMDLMMAFSFLVFIMWFFSPLHFPHSDLDISHLFMRVFSGSEDGVHPFDC